MIRKPKKKSLDDFSEENTNQADKHSESDVSEFSSESFLPLDHNVVLSERHYSWSPLEFYGRKLLRRRGGGAVPKENFKGKGPKNYSRSDEKIKDDVCERLYRSTDVDASNIEVLVSDGLVVLRGTVKTREQKKRAEFIIEHIVGVRDILNEIRLNSNTTKYSPHGPRDNTAGFN
jgi:hypothetical protein